MVAHVMINCVCEPGLVLAAIRGEMRRVSTQSHQGNR